MTILLHVGTGKTGSTFLQRHIFSDICENLNILYNPSPVQPILNLLNPRNQATYLEWDKKIDNDLFLEYKNNLNEFLISEKKDILISHEGFSSLSYHLNHEYVFKLLSYFFKEDFHIALFLRPHRQYLISLYKEIFYHGNLVKYDEFFSNKKINEKYAFNACDGDFYPKINLLEVNYSKLIDKYINLKHCRKLYLVDYLEFSQDNKKVLKKLFSNNFSYKNYRELDRIINNSFLGKRNDRISISEIFIELILRFNSLVKLEKFLLFDSKRSMRLSVLKSKNFILVFLMRLPKKVRRFFTWNFVRMILVKFPNNAFKYSGLTKKASLFLSSHSKEFELDWSNLKRKYGDLFL